MERLKLFQVARNFINFGKERKEENRERKEKTEARRTASLNIYENYSVYTDHRTGEETRNLLNRHKSVSTNKLNRNQSLSIAEFFQDNLGDLKRKDKKKFYSYKERPRRQGLSITESLNLKASGSLGRKNMYSVHTKEEKSENQVPAEKSSSSFLKRKRDLLRKVSRTEGAGTPGSRTSRERSVSASSERNREGSIEGFQLSSDTSETRIEPGVIVENVPTDQQTFPPSKTFLNSRIDNHKKSLLHERISEGSETDREGAIKEHHEAAVQDSKVLVVSEKQALRQDKANSDHQVPLQPKRCLVQYAQDKQITVHKKKLV